MNGRIVVTSLALALCVAGMPPAGEAGPGKTAPAGTEPAKTEPAGAAPAKTEPAGAAPAQGARAIERVVKSDEEWKRLLTPGQYRVLRKEGTERAFTGKYWNHHGKGIYRCAGCGLELFGSETKFDSGTGWPSYWAPVASEHVAQVADHSLGMMRIEVECARCGGHLGHLFDDGPKPTGLRYCINSASLEFSATK